MSARRHPGRLPGCRLGAAAGRGSRVPFVCVSSQTVRSHRGDTVVLSPSAACRSWAALLLSTGAIAAVAAQPPDAPREQAAGHGGPIWTVADVLALPGAEIDNGLRVTVAGVITFRNFRDGLHTVTLEDATGGVWVEIITSSDVAPDRYAIGTGLVVSGSVDRGGYAPRILADQVDVGEPAPLPEPKPVDVNRLFIGGENGRRVMIDAIVQGYREEEGIWSLVVDVSARRMVVRVPREFLAREPADLIDAGVRCVGVIGAIRNTRGQFLSPILNVSRPEDLQVTTSAPSSAFDSPAVPLPELALFSPEPLRGRRVSSGGVVTLAYPGRFFYLQEGLHGVRVETTSTLPIAPGDVVEAAGFLDMSRHIGGLVEAVYRVRESGPTPTPVAIQPSDVVRVNERSRQAGKIARPGNYHGCLILFTATLMEVRPPLGDWCGLTLADGPFILTATLPAAEFPALRQLRPGSSLRITGIADLDIVPDQTLSVGLDPLIQRVLVFVQGADDIAVLGAPSWWTPARLGLALAAALGGVTLALASNYVLYRRVVRQATSLAEQMRSRYEAEAEFQATLRERSRLAANLHDTVLQTVTGIGYQLKAMRATARRGAVPSDQPTNDLDVAQRMVDHAIHQLRGTVWAMQSLPLAGESLATALVALVHRLRTEHPATITLHTAGSAADVPELVAGNLFLVAQEAIYNALRHADASHVDVSLSYLPDESVRIEVRDDGKGFEPGRQAGAAEGHFGLESMRDRVSRLGGFWQLSSAPGNGTTITATVPLSDRNRPAPVAGASTS